MTEREALGTFALILGAMIVIGAILPTVAPGLIRILNSTVLKGESSNEERH